MEAERSRQEKLKAEGSKQGSELKLEAVEAQSSKFTAERKDSSQRLISHPDEIEKKKHFIGQADAHRPTQTIKVK